MNADLLARELNTDSYEAATLAKSIREELIRQRESFVYETVFSDPVGDKLQFLTDASAAGYTVLLCFIGTSGPATSEERVAMRVSQGGHDVPSEKLVGRYPRILQNLSKALRTLPHVWVFDNDDLRAPFHLVAVCEGGKLVKLERPVPAWLRSLLPSQSAE